MPYTYGMQNAPAVGNGLGGLPRRSALTTPTVNNQDLYSRKKVRLVKVGSQFNMGSLTTPLTNNGLPIPMGFGRFALSKTGATCAVVDYNASGIVQVRSNSSSLNSRGAESPVFRGNGAGYWYHGSTGNLNQVVASGASGSSQSTLVAVGTAAASGTLYDGRAWSAFSAPSGSSAVAKWGNYAVFVGTATVAGSTETIAVLVSLLDGTVATAMSLGAQPTYNLTVVCVYKNMLTVFGIATGTGSLYSRQINLTNGSVNMLSDATVLINTVSSLIGYQAYAAEGAVWLDTYSNPTTEYAGNYGFATDANGLATDHAAISTTYNYYTLIRNTSSGTPPQATFNELRNGPRAYDFDYNLFYGVASQSEYESLSGAGNLMFETVLLSDDYRSKGMGRVRAPIAFMESNKRLPVTLSLVAAGSGDQATTDVNTKGYETALVYLDNGYWILMATEGDGTIPSYTGYLQLMKEA